MFMINFVEYVVKLKVLITFSFSLSTAVNVTACRLMRYDVEYRV